METYHPMTFASVEGENRYRLMPRGIHYKGVLARELPVLRFLLCPDVAQIISKIAQGMDGIGACVGKIAERAAAGGPGGAYSSGATLQGSSRSWFYARASPCRTCSVRGRGRTNVLHSNARAHSRTRHVQAKAGHKVVLGYYH